MLHLTKLARKLLLIELQPWKVTFAGCTEPDEFWYGDWHLPVLFLYTYSSLPQWTCQIFHITRKGRQSYPYMVVTPEWTFDDGAQVWGACVHTYLQSSLCCRMLIYDGTSFQVCMWVLSPLALCMHCILTHSVCLPGLGWTKYICCAPRYCPNCHILAQIIVKMKNISWGSLFRKMSPCTPNYIWLHITPNFAGRHARICKVLSFVGGMVQNVPKVQMRWHQRL